MLGFRKNIAGQFAQKKVSAPKQSEFVDLAPTDKADPDGVYCRALSFATDSTNVSNIALTGPYGSGKSSIIKTFLKQYKRSALRISLAAFLPEVAEGGGDVSKQEIERSILQQMLYGSDANKLPLSRFKRIQSPGKWALVVPLCFILGVFACWHVLDNKDAIFNGKYFLPFDLANWYNYLCFLIGLAFTWTAIYQVYIRSFAISLKSVSLKEIEITSDENREASILNRHLDEIIYFFQSTKYDLVVIEDLDRFNNPDIFIKLREINSLINANSGVKRTIRFLYALRDNMFVNTDRTKFFEFIIPVIPIINSSNAIDKVLEQGKRLSLDTRLHSQFLREVSRYLNDLRLIQNIFNEYAIYISNLEADKVGLLDSNKLLAVLIYKNLLPSDFEDLHRGKGNLAALLSRHDEYIAKNEADYKRQIIELEAEIDIAEKQVVSDLDELRKVYAMTLIGKLPQGTTNISWSSHSNVPIGTISDHPEFEKLLDTKHIQCFIAQQGYNHQADISGIQNQVNSHKTYQQRKKEIGAGTPEFKEGAQKTIRDLRLKLSNLRVAKFNEIIRVDAKETDGLFDGFGENRELARFLVFEGYLDDTYYQYTSLFHSGRLSPNDNKFLIQIRSFTNPDPDFPIDNPKEVITEMREDDFRQSYVLNLHLVDCLFSNPAEYGSKISNFLGFISSNFADCTLFFSAYYERGKFVEPLVSALVNRWPEFVAAAIDSADDLAHMANVLAYVPDRTLRELQRKDDRLSLFVSDRLPDILAIGVPFEPARLKLVRPEIKDLVGLQSNPAVYQLVFEEGLYDMSFENLAFIFHTVLGVKDLGPLRTKNYTTIINAENAALSEKIEGNFERYLINVVLTLDQNSEEDVAAIITALNHDEADLELLQTFLDRQAAVLPSLDQVPDRFHAFLFEERKIEPAWENCLAFLTSEEGDPEILTTYLQDANVLAKLSKIQVGGGQAEIPLNTFLISNDALPNDVYRTYIKVLPYQFTRFPENLDEQKLSILVEDEGVEFSPESLSELEENVALQVLFISRNMDSYLEVADQVEMDDDFRERLLKASITDDQKLKVIGGMDMSLLPGLPARAGVIGPILDRTNALIDSIDPAVGQVIIKNTKAVRTQISLFNKLQTRLSDTDVRDVIQNLPRPFCDIVPSWKQPTLENTVENRAFVDWLEKRRMISSSKLTFLEEIRIHNFRP